MIPLSIIAIVTNLLLIAVFVCVIVCAIKEDKAKFLRVNGEVEDLELRLASVEQALKYALSTKSVKYCGKEISVNRVFTIKNNKDKTVVNVEIVNDLGLSKVVNFADIQID